jgi:hypothetical protein
MEFDNGKGPHRTVGRWSLRRGGADQRIAVLGYNLGGVLRAALISSRRPALLVGREDLNHPTSRLSSVCSIAELPARRSGRRDGRGAGRCQEDPYAHSPPAR